MIIICSQHATEGSKINFSHAILNKSQDNNEDQIIRACVHVFLPSLFANSSRRKPWVSLGVKYGAKKALATLSPPLKRDNMKI